MKWIIVNCNYGGLGNRLHTHANILAWCMRNNYSLLNLSFRPYTKLYHPIGSEYADICCNTKGILYFIFKINFCKNIIEKICLSKKWLSRFSFIIEIIERDEFTQLNEKQLDLLIKNPKRIILIKAWDIRCLNSLEIQSLEIRKFFTPRLNYVDNAVNFIKNLRIQYDCLVGVHARRGDYKEYLNGDHFHSWEDYQNWILEAKFLLEKEGFLKVGFILCSDENPMKSIFFNLPVHFNETNDIMTDMHSLSLCDFNIGPPSSFGTWISWFGQVPRCVIKRFTSIKSIDQFQFATTC